MSPRRRVVACALGALLFTAALPSKADTLALVMRADCGLIELDPASVQRLFLGRPVMRRGRVLRAIRNRSDDRLYEAFLRHVVAMSPEAYERALLDGMNREGWVRPGTLNSPALIISELRRDPSVVSFMWIREVERDPSLRVIAALPCG